MGRWLLVLSSWLSLATVAFSQTSEEELAWDFRGGFTGGFSASQVRGDGIDGFNKLGLYGGLIVDVRKYTNVGLQLGLLYHDKGSRKVRSTRLKMATGVLSAELGKRATFHNSKLSAPMLVPFGKLAASFLKPSSSISFICFSLSSFFAFSM